MTQPIVHGILLALGLILPLGAQNVFVFNQEANKINQNHKTIIVERLNSNFSIPE